MTMIQRNIAFWVMLFILLPLRAVGQTGQPAFLSTFRPVERVHDFGTVYERNGKLTHTFVLKNRGQSTVAISNVNTWCGCMVAEYTKSGIRPGEKAKVKVTFDPDHKQGNFVKQVVLLLNGGTSYVRLWVKANVVPYRHPVQESCPYDFGHGLYMSQRLLPFPELGAGQDYSFDLQIGNDTNRPMTVTFRRTPNNTVLKMPGSVKLGPKEVRTVKVSYHFYHQYKETRYVLITPVINGKNGKQLKVQWNAGRKFRLGF